MAFSFFCNSAYCKNENIVCQIEDRLHVGVCIYIGHTGPIRDGLYIKRNDSFNAVYSLSKGIIAGADSKNIDEIQILKIIIKDRDNINVEYCNALDYSSKDLYIVFSKNDIYVLDFSNSKFYKYHRTMEQYAKHFK